MTTKLEFEVSHEEKKDPYENYYYISEVSPKLISVSCPHCSIFVSLQIGTYRFRNKWDFDVICSCPNCTRTVFAQVTYREDSGESQLVAIYPNKNIKESLNDVPEQIYKDYSEARLILGLSPKASAAICRRLLQTILQDKFQIHERNLVTEIQEFVERSDVPSYLTDAVDAVRQVGNLAAHPSKNQQTGEVVEVEPGEAEWLIEVVASLLDFAYTQPIKLKKRKEELDKKLAAARKQSIKV